MRSISSHSSTEWPRVRRYASVASVGLVLTALAWAGWGTSSTWANSAGRVHTVTIEAMAFTPATLRLRLGDQIVFQNKDLVPHTATAPGRFDSGSIAPDRSWRYTVTERGVVDYVCTFHPAMKGILRVE